MKIEFNKLNAKAIIWGFLTDIVGTFVFGFIFSLVVISLYAANGGNIDNIDNLMKSYYVSVPLMSVSLFFGLAFTVLGGYITGRIAKGYEMLNSIAVGIIEVAFGMLLSISGSSYPLWYNVIGFVLMIPATYLGGMIAKRLNIIASFQKIKAE